MRWTKGFDICDGVGSNPAECLTRALQQRGWSGGVAALLNDGIGIFGAGRYQHPRTAVSMILGTGARRPHACRRGLVSCVLALGRRFPGPPWPRTALNRATAASPPPRADFVPPGRSVTLGLAASDIRTARVFNSTAAGLPGGTHACAGLLMRQCLSRRSAAAHDPDSTDTPRRRSRLRTSRRACRHKRRLH